MQLDREGRGFSFQKEGPLDMRMDLSQSLTAADIVNGWSEKDLGVCLKEYGEEPFWKRISKAIVEARRKEKITTTTQLSEIIKSVSSSYEGKRIHPATLVFQALRICVNKELEHLEGALKQAIKHLSKNGRIGVISFHSLEDRIVKHIFKAASEPMRDLRGMKISEPELRLLTKKPILPKLREVRTNRRARSAKLRFAEKI
jgi:16S rRNA (cytosine1402-N4)-methyltransferase